MKLTSILLTVLLGLSHATSQETAPLSIYTNIAIGLSFANYVDNTWGGSVRGGVTINYDGFNARFDRMVNNEMQSQGPQEKISTNSILIGYSLHVIPKYEEADVVLSGRLGLGYAESSRPAHPFFINPSPENANTPLIVEKTTGGVWELDLEVRLSSYVGFSFGGLWNSNPVRSYHTITSGLLLGFF